MSRIVVIGAGGCIGGAIATTLESQGAGVLRLGRRDVDLLAPDAADRLAGLLRDGDRVVAASAMAPVKSPAMLADNLVMVRAMVEALGRRCLTHVLNISSDAVYADGPLPLSEASPAAPTSLHGAMHLARELAFATLPCPLAHLRPTLVYGAADPHNGYGPNRFRRLAEKGEAITLFGEGEERRDHVLVDDVAELAARMVRGGFTGVLNAATGTVWSFRQIAEMMGVAVHGSPRAGAMPHGGYRPFEPAATLAAFPDFRYTPLPEGLKKCQNSTC